MKKKTRPLERKKSISTDNTSRVNQEVASISSPDGCSESDELDNGANNGKRHYPIVSDVDKTIFGSSAGYNSDLSLLRSQANDCNQRKDQLRRLRLVSSQAFLFVANYALVATWGGLMAIAEQMAESRDEELSVLVQMYPTMVLNAIFSPLQGFLNLLVYIRPKYLKWGYAFPRETRRWAFRRAIFGDKILPENRAFPPWQEGKAPQETGQIGQQQKVLDAGSQPCNLTSRLPKAIMSNLSASQSDFDHMLGEGEKDLRLDCGIQDSKHTWTPM